MSAARICAAPAWKRKAINSAIAAALSGFAAAPAFAVAFPPACPTSVSSVITTCTAAAAGSFVVTSTGSVAGSSYPYGIYYSGALTGSLINSGTVSSAFNAGNVQNYGIYIGGGDLAGSLTNEGTVSTSATIANNWASSTGVYVASLSGALANRGTISTTVTNTNSLGNAYAYGVVVSNPLSGTLTNSGTISANAANPAGYASAYGVVVQNTLSGSLSNSGIISATANAGEYANVNGVAVWNILSGSLSNSGSISTTASAGKGAWAAGAYVGTALNGSLNNSGSISATANGGTNAWAAGVYAGSALNGILNNSGSISASASIAGVSSNGNAYSLVVGGGTGTINNLSSGVLSGNLSVGGTVTVNNAGTIAIPAGASGTIAGTYNQLTGGVLQTSAASNASFGKLTVGTANLTAGNTIAVHATLGNTLAAGNVLQDVLSTTTWTGLASGAAVKVIGTPLFTFTGVEDGAHHIDVTIASKNSFAGVLGSLGNPSIAGLGSTLDSLTPGGAMDPLLNALYGLNSKAELEAAAQQLLPYTGLGLATSDALRGISRIIQSRQDANRGLSSGDEFFGDRQFWFKPFGSRADQGEHGGVSGYLARTFGVAVGADGKLANDTRIGGAFTYSRTDVNSAFAARQAGDVDVYQVILYGSQKLSDRLDLDFQADYGINKNNGNRQIAIGPLVNTATSSYKGWNTHLGASLGRSYAFSADTTFVPSVRADYSYLHTNGYTESGAGAANLAVSANNTDELVLGVDGKVIHSLGNGMSLVANLGAGYDTLSKRSSITSSFVGGGAAFATPGLDSSPWMLRGGLGVVVTNTQALEITARYDVESRSSSFTNQTASVRLRMPF